MKSFPVAKCIESWLLKNYVSRSNRKLNCYQLKAKLQFCQSAFFSMWQMESWQDNELLASRPIEKSSSMTFQFASFELFSFVQSWSILEIRREMVQKQRTPPPLKARTKPHVALEQSGPKQHSKCEVGDRVKAELLPDAQHWGSLALSNFRLHKLSLMTFTQLCPTKLGFVEVVKKKKKWH